MAHSPSTLRNADNTPFSRKERRLNYGDLYSNIWSGLKGYNDTSPYYREGAVVALKDGGKMTLREFKSYLYEKAEEEGWDSEVSVGLYTQYSDDKPSEIVIRKWHDQ